MCSAVAVTLDSVIFNAPILKPEASRRLWNLPARLRKISLCQLLLCHEAPLPACRLRTNLSMNVKKAHKGIFLVFTANPPATPASGPVGCILCTCPELLAQRLKLFLVLVTSSRLLLQIPPAPSTVPAQVFRPGIRGLQGKLAMKFQVMRTSTPRVRPVRVSCRCSAQPASSLGSFTWQVGVLAMLFLRGLQGPLPQMGSVRLQPPVELCKAYMAVSWRARNFSAARRRHASNCLASLLSELPIHQVAADCGRPPFAEVPAMTAGSFWTSRWTSALLRHRSLRRKQMSSRQPPSKAKAGCRASRSHAPACSAGREPAREEPRRALNSLSRFQGLVPARAPHACSWRPRVCTAPARLRTAPLQPTFHARRRTALDGLPSTSTSGCIGRVGL